jgi:hypothetical protein
MKRDSRQAVRRLALLVAILFGLAVVCSAGAGADPSPSSRSPASAGPAREVVGIADAVCVQRGPFGPQPCQRG